MTTHNCAGISLNWHWKWSLGEEVRSRGSVFLLTAAVWTERSAPRHSTQEMHRSSARLAAGYEQVAKGLSRNFLDLSFNDWRSRDSFLKEASVRSSTQDSGWKKSGNTNVKKKKKFLNGIRHKTLCFFLWPALHPPIISSKIVWVVFA